MKAESDSSEAHGYGLARDVSARGGLACRVLIDTDIGATLGQFLAF